MREITEAREHVAGKHSLRHPKFPGTTGPLEAHERTKDLHTVLDSQKVARKSLVPRLGPKTVPFKIIYHVAISIIRLVVA
jgi:hypothetical protein